MKRTGATLCATAPVFINKILLLKVSLRLKTSLILVRIIDILHKNAIILLQKLIRIMFMFAFKKF